MNMLLLGSQSPSSLEIYGFLLRSRLGLTSLRSFSPVGVALLGCYAAWLVGSVDSDGRVYGCPVLWDDIRGWVDTVGVEA